MKTCLLLLLSLSVADAAPSFVDLPTVMRLAGAKNEEVEHARTQHKAAVLESNQAWQRFWPTLNIGAQYRGHNGEIQDVAGTIFEADKLQYVVGAGVMVGMNRGDRLQSDRGHGLHIDWGLCPGKMSYQGNRNNDLLIWRKAVGLR